MPFSNPSVADFKARFTRDFPYDTDPKKGVLDSDIATAFVDTNVTISQRLFGDQASYTAGYLQLSAHYLVSNIQASTQGLNGTYEWLVTSKSVGSVSQSFGIPDRVLNNPAFSAIAKTNYGAKYLSMIWPSLIGPGFAIRGMTHP